MILFAPLALAAVAVSDVGPATEDRGRGVEIAAAQVRAQILRPGIVRQDSGLRQDPDGPVPQVSRRGRTVLIEFQ